MRFLVLGATGMAGHVVSLYLSESGHDVIGFGRRPVRFLANSIVGDALDFASVEGAVSSVRPDVVVNCIGLLNRACEEHPDRAIFLNAFLPRKLEALTAGADVRVFHLSTDCVFAGNTGPYEEDSVLDGVTLYDRSKALGEINNNKDLTLRQSIVGPDMDPDGIGLLNWFMAQEGSIQGYTEAIWTGLTTLELAKAVEQCAFDGSTGLVNMVPDTAISKFDLLNLFNEHLCADFVDVVPNDAFRLDKTLVRTNLVPTFCPAPYARQVAELAAWVEAHRGLYPHYALKDGLQ